MLPLPPPSTHIHNLLSIWSKACRISEEWVDLGSPRESMPFPHPVLLGITERRPNLSLSRKDGLQGVQRGFLSLLAPSLAQTCWSSFLFPLHYGGFSTCLQFSRQPLPTFKTKLIFTFSIFIAFMFLVPPALITLCMFCL